MKGITTEWKLYKNKNKNKTEQSAAWKRLRWLIARTQRPHIQPTLKIRIN